MKIARQAKGAAGVLEFVTPGCPTCRSFYRDTSSFPVQISIMFHVAGHNDFSVYSPFALRRQADPIAASLELAEMVQDYSRRFDADAVHLFYQYLSSFSFLQDINYGEFTHPDHLNNAGLRDADLKRVVHGEGKRDPYREAGVIGPFPKQPNISGLQAMVGYLKGRGPEWKYKLASKYEEMVRVYGYVPVTKIMNEGWATFLQIFLTAHSRWNNSKSVLEFANLLSGVAYPQLTNPYWMGLEAWLRVYKNFVKENPIGPGMTMLERDRRFVQHAHGMIEWMTDADFLRHALDEQWVTDMNLFLSRPASEQEVDPTLPPDPMHPDYNEQNVVVSRDPKRVINFITDLVANKKKHLPRITVKNMRSLDRNVFHFAHEVYENYPLERSSTAQTLYVAAQVLGAPMALDTIDQRKVIKQMPYPEDWPDFWRRFMPPPTTVTYEPVPIRVEVDLGGKVAVFEQVKNAADGELLERENKEIATEMQAAIAAYQDSVTGLVNGDLERDWRHLYADSGKMMMRIADHNTTHVIEGVVHDPNSSAAIAEYTRVIKSVGPARLRELMKRARRTATGIAIPILPDIPEFSFDREMVETLKNLEPPAPVDANERIRPFEKILSATSKTSNSGVGALIASTTIDLSRYAGTSASVQMLLDQVKSFVNQAGRREIIFTGSDKAERLVQEVMNVLLKESVSTID
ncbi:MAG TPA: SpoVR family protein, partial [Oligoflexia bacterium]|nr:SpoVR family protein [Oligoflexia bacterium]